MVLVAKLPINFLRLHSYGQKLFLKTPNLKGYLLSDLWLGMMRDSKEINVPLEWVSSWQYPVLKHLLLQNNRDMPDCGMALSRGQILESIPTGWCWSSWPFHFSAHSCLCGHWILEARIGEPLSPVFWPGIEPHILEKPPLLHHSWAFGSICMSVLENTGKWLILSRKKKLYSPAWELKESCHWAPASEGLRCQCPDDVTGTHRRGLIFTQILGLLWGMDREILIELTKIHWLMVW